MLVETDGGKGNGARGTLHHREEVSNINWTGLARSRPGPPSGYATQAWIQILRREADGGRGKIGSTKVIKTVGLDTGDEEKVQRDPKVQELDKRVQDGLERLRTLTGEKFRSRKSSVVHHLDSDKANVQRLARLIQGARGEKRTLVRKLRRGLREEKKKIKDKELLKKAAGGFNEMTEAAKVLASTSRARLGGQYTFARVYGVKAPKPTQEEQGEQAPQEDQSLEEAFGRSQDTDNAQEISDAIEKPFADDIEEEDEAQTEGFLGRDGKNSSSHVIFYP
ncbi:unnamed protein product [Tilletia controversa]|nr:unnamed protein product [Tilletia controversa]CAD6916793.1 unnamed protein product [Tilletia controversa]